MVIKTPRVKICCISSIAEAALAVSYGASAVGLVSSMPSGPGVIEESLIEEIAQTVPPGVASFLLTSSTDPDKIVAQQRRCRANTLQLCDATLRCS
jgi:phosphoribosylanthranilate isomerase